MSYLRCGEGVGEAGGRGVVARSEGDGFSMGEGGNSLLDEPIKMFDGGCGGHRCGSW